MIFDVEIKNGKLKVLDEKFFLNWIKSQKDKKTNLEIRNVAQRTIKSNNKYWVAIVEPFAEYTGMSKEECHLFLKKKFLSKIEIIDDIKYLIVLSTRDCNNEEMSKYINDCSKFLFDEFEIITGIE